MRVNSIFSLSWELAGETLYGLCKRRDVSRDEIRLWIATHGLEGSLGRRANPKTFGRAG